MLRKEMTKVEIERELHGKGDYVQIDNITRFLKENLPLDIKKFVYLKLVEIYERRNMFLDAAEVYGRVAELALNSSEKVNFLIKETENYIRAGFFDKADLSTKRTLLEAKPNERPKISLSIKEFYKNQAQVYEKERRRNKAVKTYEKIITMDISEPNKNEINKKLLELYKELGMIEQYMKLKSQVKI